MPGDPASGPWPGTESHYRIGGTGSQPDLAVTVSIRPDWLVPGPDEAPQATSRQAREQAERYRLARLAVSSSTVSLLTSLSGAVAMPAPDGAPALARFARAAELFAGAMAAATSPTLTGVATLGELLDRYGLSPEQLAAVNADRPLNELLAAGQHLARQLGQAAPVDVPAEPRTLAEVAAGLHLPAGRLLAGNRGLRLAAAPTAVLPGRVALPADARIAYPLRDGDTLAVLARRFASTARELVAANADVAGTLLPGIRVEVAVESGSQTALTGTDTLAGDSFAAVCQRLASQRADVSLDAVADALDRLGPVLSPGPVLSCPLAALGSDAPVTGADVQAEYGCSPQAFAAANAAVLGLLQPGVRLGLDGADTTTTEHDTLHAVLDRLRSGGSRPTLDRLLAGADGLPLFRAGARALLPPIPATTLTVALGPLDVPAAAAPLVVTLRLAGATAAEHVDTPVPPSADRDAFVAGCLTALPTLRLATDVAGRWWAVSFDERGIAAVRVEPAAGGATEPRAFALRPLYPAPVGFAAVIRPVTARGDLGEPVIRNYSDVDVEPWAQRFLTDLDGYLAEPLLGRLPEAVVARLADCRRRLSQAVAAGLAPLRPENTGPGADTALRHARLALASAAGTGLAGAYRIAVLAQYRAVVVSPYGADGHPPAALLATVHDPGSPGLAFSSGRTELAPSDATCTFGLTPAEPGVLAAVSSQPREVIDGLEFGAAGMPLRFARPLTGDYRVETLLEDLPPVRLPVPLREQPQPVPVEPVTTEATFDAARQPELAEAVRWTAGLSYHHQHAAQDVVRISIRSRLAAPAPRPADTALAEALAGYLAAADQLLDLIGAEAADGTESPAPEGTGGTESPAPEGTGVRDRAAASLLVLVEEVGAAWRRHRSVTAPAVAGTGFRDGNRSGGGDLEAGFSGDYRLRAVYSADGRLDRLLVSRTAVAGNWPHITLTGAGESLPLTPGAVHEGSREYTATGAAITSPLSVRLEWPGLRGASQPAARVTVTLERNGALPVDPAFMLTAQPVQVAVPNPSLRWEQEITLPGTDLGQALRDAFEILAVGQPEHLSGFEVRYVEPVDGLPVERLALTGDLVLGVENADRLAAVMRDWQREVQPATTGATWLLRLSVPSARDGEPPLLTFERLVYPVQPSDGPGSSRASRHPGPTRPTLSARATAPTPPPAVGEKIIELPR